jgi:hypothetical protein
MSKQRLERYVSKQLGDMKNIWFQKNQVMPLSFTQSVGDFIILTKNKNFIFECKECNDKDNKARFNFARLTQLNDLWLFQDSLERNISVLVLMFWGGSVKKSGIFIIPLKNYLHEIEKHNKKSMNRKECIDMFGDFQIQDFEELNKTLSWGNEYEY